MLNIKNESNEMVISNIIMNSRYQKMLIIFLCVLIAPFMAFNNITQYLIMLEPEYVCNPSNVSTSAVSWKSGQEWSGQSRLNHSQVGETLYNPSSLFLELERSCYVVTNQTRRPHHLSNSNKNQSKEYPQKNMKLFSNKIEYDAKLSESKKISCPNGYKYKYDFIYPTVVSLKNWICENSGSKYFTHSIYWFGSIVGSIFFGQISDRYGRIPVIIACHLIGGAAGSLTPFSEQNTYLFMTLRFLVGFVVLSQGSITFLLVMEILGPYQRSLVSNLYLASFSITAALLPWLAYALHDWEYLAVLTSVPLLIIPMIAYYIPESIKWLISNDRIEEAKIIIKRIAKINQKSIANETLQNIDLRHDIVQLHSALNKIFNYKRFLIIFTLTNIVWFCQSIAYTGAIGFATISTDNPYMILTINSVIDVIAAIAAYYASEHWGRKGATVLPCVISGLLYPIAATINQDDQVVIFFIFAMGARLFLTIAYNVHYLYAVEVYPTNIRGRAYSLRMAIGSLGNLIAPQILSLESIDESISLVTFGIVSLVPAVIAFFLPETMGLNLPKTLLDSECIGLVSEEKAKVTTRYRNMSISLTLGSEKDSLGMSMDGNGIQMNSRSSSSNQGTQEGKESGPH